MLTTHWLKRLLILGIWSALVIAPIAMATPKDFSQLETLAIQERGRVKPLHTFAEESVQYLTGKRSWKGAPPLETVFSWLITFSKDWPTEPFLLVDSAELRTALHLDPKRRHFSPDELATNENLKNILREALPKQRKNQPLNELEKKAADLQSRRGMLEAIVTGRAWTILPNSENIAQPWYSLRDLTDRSAAAGYTADQMQALSKVTGELLQAFSGDDKSKWDTAAGGFSSFIRNELGRGHYPEIQELKREVFYNKMRPFRWAWALYLLAFCLLTAAVISKKRPLLIAGSLALGWGFLIHTFGFGLRMMIAGRPPVTNMYESVIWVSWGCILFGMIISLAYKSPIINAAASVFAVVALVLADTVPTVLDPSIQPLEPVLRNNFWLTVHVLTITLSYAAFALSLCLGNVVLGTYLFSPKNIERVQINTLYMYRAIQIGVVLLASGTILGGVWAAYSWGRFWGWDPKEVWALIALLLYLAVLHGRFSGWLQGFGFTVGAVLSFMGVMMAWYGVNFVLGAGMHSYGFGSGGSWYMLGLLVAQLVFIRLAYSKYRQLDENTKKKTRLVVK